MESNDELRKLAEAATPGPWRFSPNAHDGWSQFALISTSWWTVEDMTYIAAANPQAVLALLDRLDAMEAALIDIAMEGGCLRPGCACIGDLEAHCDVGTAKLAIMADERMRMP